MIGYKEDQRRSGNLPIMPSPSSSRVSTLRLVDPTTANCDQPVVEC